MIGRKRESDPDTSSMGPIQVAEQVAETCDECGKNALEVTELIIGNGECICSECLPTTENPLFVAYREGELQ